MSGTQEVMREVVAHLTRIRTVDGVRGLLGWDESTQMPEKGASNRGAQQAVLAGLMHEWSTDPRVGEWLAALKGSRDPVEAACHRNLSRAYARQRRVPAELVDELARAQSAGFAAWLDAKAKSDFSIFAPHLERLLSLSVDRARTIDPSRHPYDVVLEEFDPGTTHTELRGMFSRLRDELTPLIAAIAERPPVAPIDRAFDLDTQRAMNRAVATALGYDFAGGRLDHAEHPFSVSLGQGDVRITHHLEEQDLLGGLGGTIHEVGHAMYEQGLPFALVGTTVCEAASFGLHESQSRFWENFIARSAAFARWLAGVLETHFPGTGLRADALYRASNRVQRSERRVSADEVTYNLHVIVRFELELALFEGALTVADLPAAWNEKYQEYLGLTPGSDARGVLQDVHWSGASFGYFPSYTLGNLYAASLGKTLEAKQPDLWEHVERGEFQGVLAFLRENIHQKGHLLEAPEIIRAAVGERDHVADLIDHFYARHGALYGVSRS